MNTRNFVRILSIFSICLLSSCKMRTPKQKSWSNPEFKGHTLGRTMVLATGDNELSCRQYEAMFVNRLLPYLEAGSMHASQDVTGKITRESLDSQLKANGVKTIIVTSILDESNRNKLMNSGYNAAPYSGGYWGYYSFGYSRSANMANISNYMEFVLETNVYDVETQKLVWSGQKLIFDDRAQTDNMELVIKGVVKKLERQGMLK